MPHITNRNLEEVTNQRRRELIQDANRTIKKNLMFICPIPLQRRQRCEAHHYEHDSQTQDERQNLQVSTDHYQPSILPLFKRPSADNSAILIIFLTL